MSITDPRSAVDEYLRKKFRKFTPLPVRDNRRRGESQTPASFGDTPGATLHLLRTATQSIAVGGEAISWDLAHTLVPITFTVPTLPATDITIIQTGYYNVSVEASWSSFTGGGSMTVERVRGATTLVAWPPVADPGLWTSTTGTFFEGVSPAIPCEVGDIIRVVVDADDASPQTLDSAVVGVYFVDSQLGTSFYRELILSHTPRAYWRFDETSGSNADDIAGHADGPFDATYVSSPTLDQGGVMLDGSGSASVLFNGSTQYATVPLATVQGLEELTVEMWINRDTEGTTTHATFGVNNSSLGGGEWNRWVMWVSSGDVFQYRESGQISLDGVITIGTGVHHIVLTRTFPDTVAMYVDGVFDNSSSGTAWRVSASGDTVQIGMETDSSGPSDHFDGLIDEITIYEYPLTQAQIEEHYRVGTQGP